MRLRGLKIKDDLKVVGDALRGLCRYACRISTQLMRVLHGQSPKARTPIGFIENYLLSQFNLNLAD